MCVLQTSFYVLGGGRDSFTGLMRDEVTTLQTSQSNVKYWIGAGLGHCIGQGSGYYTETAQDGSGVGTIRKFRDTRAPPLANEFARLEGR